MYASRASPEADLSFGETVLLGTLAGFTIYLGLPLGRLQVLGDRARVALSMFSVGVLAFLFVDVLEHGFGVVEHLSKRSGTATAGSEGRSASPQCWPLA